MSLFFAKYLRSPEELRNERFGRTRELCERNGVDAILAFAGDSISKRGYVRFLSNYPTPTQTSAVFFPLRGDPTLLLTYITHLHWARETTWIEDVQLSPGYAGLLPALATAAGVGTGRIGLVGADYLSTPILAAVRSALPKVTWIPLDQPFLQMRQHKTATDLAMLRQAAGLADLGFAAISEAARPGVTEADLFGRIEYLLRREGAEGALILLGTGPRHNMPFPVHRALKQGDVLRVSIEPIAPGGYIGQFIRVYSIGNATDEVRSRFHLCRQIEQAAVARLVPGVPIKEAADAAMDLLGTAGSVRAEVALGHGMGLDLSEPPRLHTTDPTVLAEDMVITVHPGIYYEAFGIFLGETYHITADGPVGLSTYSRDLIEI